MIKRRKPAESAAVPASEPMQLAPNSPADAVDVPAETSAPLIWWHWLLGALVILGAGTGYWFYRNGRANPAVAVNQTQLLQQEMPPDDPRLTFKTPFRNVHPDVKYVGDKACTSCHQEVSHAFHQHSMGRSITPIAEIAPKQSYDASKNNPFQALKKEFRVERTGNQVVHRETMADEAGKPLVDMQVTVEYAIGSGTHACSYLYLRDDRVMQSPISWYSQKQRWDLSPGFNSPENTDILFSRPVSVNCLFCHVNRVEQVEGSMNRYKLPLFPQGSAIGCERCHGPGSLHVRERIDNLPLSGKVDYTIVNPVHLEPELREAVCNQCHLEGTQRVARRGRQPFDFRPGLPLSLFISNLVSANEHNEGKFTGHVEQMHASQCYQGSQGKMGCVSCHNPHQPLTQIKPEVYRQQCINCHQDKGCSLPLPQRTESKDNCVACHMPRRESSDIQHTAISDHRILKKKGAEHAVPHKTTGPSPLVHFDAGQYKPDAAEANRDLAIALVELAKQVGPENRSIGPYAMSLLVQSLERWPSDLPAMEAQASLFGMAGQAHLAIDLLEKVLARAPEQESAIAAIANFALQTGDIEKAFKYAQQAVKLNPHLIGWRHRLAQIYLIRKEYDKAIAECEHAIKQSPNSVRMRTMLVGALLQAGNTAKAQAEFKIILQLEPTKKAELQEWFETQRK